MTAPGSLHDSTDGGIAGRHPDASDLQLLTASSTEKQSNTAHLRLIPVACWRVDDVRFAFDSSSSRLISRRNCSYYSMLDPLIARRIRMAQCSIRRFRFLGMPIP